VNILLRHPGIRLLVGEFRLWQDLARLFTGRRVVPGHATALAATSGLWFLPGALTVVTAVEVVAVELLVRSLPVRIIATAVSVYSLLLLWAFFGRRKVYPHYVDATSLVVRHGRTPVLTVPRDQLQLIIPHRTHRAERAAVVGDALVIGNGTGTNVKIILSDAVPVTDPDRWPWQSHRTLPVRTLLLWVDEPPATPCGRS
jgi:hypothetical protein